MKLRDLLPTDLDAIIFDFNGTLSDDEELVFEAIQSAARSMLAIPLSFKEYESDLLGMSDSDIARALLKDHATEPRIEQFLQILKDHYIQGVRHTPRITPATQEMIHDLHQAGIPLVIVSGADADLIHFALDELELRHYFEHIITDRDVSAGKPDPEGFLRAREMLGLPFSSRVVVFEDSIAGLQAARAARLDPIAITGSAPIDLLRPLTGAIIETMALDAPVVWLDRELVP